MSTADVATESGSTVTGLRAGTERLLTRWLADSNGEELQPSDLDDRQVDAAEAAFRRTGAALGVFDEAATDPVLPSAARFQWHVIEHAVQAEVRRFASSSISVWPSFTLSDSPREPTPINGLTPATLVEQVNVNTCQASDLEALPGLGKRTAQRIITKRSEAGPFHNLDEVHEAAQTSRKSFDRAKPFLKIGWSRDPVITALSTSIDEEGIAALVAAINDGELKFSWLRSTNSIDVLVETLEHVASTIAQRAGRPRFWKPSTERLMRGSLALDMRDAQRGGLSTGRAAKVAPVPSGAYIRLLESLIDAAEQRIWCQMFFFHVGNAGSPGDRIVTKLQEAVARGVDVRLILDHDLPGDYHNARQVNEAAFEALRKAKVPVRPSHPDITAHGKSVAFDSDRVLCGSHNWTSSSFFRYEETSLLVVSEQLAEHVTAHHEQRWKLLAENAEERVVELAVLELLSPWQSFAAAEVGIRTGTELADKGRLIAGRRELGEAMRLAEDDVERLRDMVILMQAFRISETTATALTWHDLETVSQVRNASRDAIEEALADLSDIPAPFNVRRIPPGIVDYLWQLK
jgi:hypothetical protein